MRLPLGRALAGLLAASCTGPSSDVQNVLRVHEVRVDPGSSTVPVGATMQLSATARTGSGILVTNRPVSWSSNAPELASVSQGGVVSATRAGGPVQITATVDGVPGSALVTITPEPITRVTLTPAEATLLMGTSTQLSAAASDGSGHPVTGALFSWQSSDPAIADVTGTGRVFAIAPGGPVTITASTGTISGTAKVTVSPVASRLAFAEQPASGVAGQTLPGPVRVMVQDPNGTLLASSTAQVTLRLGNNPGGATLAGSITVSAVGGVASFSDLKLDLAGSGYTLIASATGVLEATSAPFDIAPIVLTIASQPSTTGVSGQPLAQQPVVRVGRNASSPLGGVPVTASIATGGGTLGGITTVTSDPGGTASFTNLSISGSPGPRTLRFAAPGAGPVTSTAIQIANAPAGTPPHLAFLEQPSNGTAGRPLSPPVRVVVQDANGNTVTSSAAPVTIALGNNPSSGRLGGTLTVNAVNGIASFGNLVVDRPGNGYTLVASSSGIAGTTSAPFNVLGLTLALVISPSATATSGVPFEQQPVILVRDGNNLTLSGVAVTVTVASGTGILGGATTSITTANGAASFEDLTITGPPEAHTLQFDAAGAIPVTSGPIAVVSTPSLLVFTQQPPSGRVGQPLTPPIQVALRDQYGNTVPGANPVSIRLGNNPGNAVLSGTTTVNAVNGVATFGDLALDKPGTGYTLVVSSSGLTGATSAAFNVTPVSLTITTQPSATATSGQPFAQQPVITVRDGGSQPLSGVPVTVTIASGGGVLGGIATVNSNASGVASFTNLAITGQAGSRTLSFAAPGASPAVSNPIVVSTPPAQLTFTQQPTNGTAGQPLNPAIQVAIQDATGSTATTASSPVTIQLGSNPGAASLAGTLTVNAVNGVATFSDLSVDRAGTGYTLIASSSGLPNRTSAAFTIGPAMLTMATQPSSSVPSAQPFPQQPVIQVRNAANAALSGVVVTATIASGGGTLGGTATATSDQNGLATFANLSIAGTVGNRTLSFAATGAAAVVSNAIAITPGAASQLTITTQPAATAARNTAFTRQPVIQLRDASGNAVSQSGVAVTASLASGPSNAVLGGTVTVTTNASGVAAFTNLSINRAGTFTLLFSSGSLQSVVSSSIVIP